MFKNVYDVIVVLVLLLRKRQSCEQDFFHKKDVTVCTPNMAAGLTDSILNMIVKNMRPLSIVELLRDDQCVQISNKVPNFFCTVYVRLCSFKQLNAFILMYF